MKTIELTCDGKVGRIILNDPARKNPISVDVLREISEALDELLLQGARCAIISGQGGSFCSGYSLDANGEGEHKRPARPLEDIWRLNRLGELLLAIRRHPVVTIAEVRGFCVAGGTDLLLAVDIAVAAKEAEIGLPNIRALGISLLAPFWSLVVGPMRTKLLMYTGDRIDGALAEQWGLVALSAPESRLGDIVTRLARRISLTPEELLYSVKGAANRAFEAIGTEALVAAGVELDALAHVSGPTIEFWETVKRTGLKSALKERDALYAGDDLAAIFRSCSEQ